MFSAAEKIIGLLKNISMMWVLVGALFTAPIVYITRYFHEQHALSYTEQCHETVTDKECKNIIAYDHIINESSSKDRSDKQANSIIQDPTDQR